MTTVHKSHRQADGQTDWHHGISARCIITSHLALKNDRVSDEVIRKMSNVRTFTGKKNSARLLAPQ